MKKKLLSLVLAGAMVASTSVSAFADDRKVTFQENETGETDITITGEVTNSTGQTLPGTLNVTVPTNANFAITKDGNFTAPKINITNNSNKSIDVLAYEFIDIGGPDEGIKIVEKGETSNRDRKDISLNISGGAGIAYFKSEDSSSTKKGVYKDPALLNGAEGDGIKIAEIAGNGTSRELKLDGVAGTQNTQNAASNEFTLKLKIKKTQQAS